MEEVEQRVYEIIRITGLIIAIIILIYTFIYLQKNIEYVKQLNSPLEYCRSLNYTFIPISNNPLNNNDGNINFSRLV